MSNPVVKFGLVGCGRVSENHAAALSGGHIPTSLVAVCDVDAKLAKAKGEKYHVPWFTDYHEMVKAHPEIEAFSVATPTGYHARHVMDLARHGKHIVVEKPMALRVEDCDAMMAACRENDCRLFVVQQNRFNPSVVAARQALEAGRFGKMVVGTVRVRWQRTQHYYEQDEWHGTWELDGGVMSQQASHHLDLLQWFLGPIESVQCQTATRLMDIEVEDTALAIIRFQSGALGSFEATVAARPESLEGSLSLLGEHGSVVIGGHAVNKMQYWKFEHPTPDDEHMTHRASEEVPNVYGRGHGPYLAAVAQAIMERRPGAVEGPEGKKNIQILAALYESAASNGASLAPGCPIRNSKLGRAPVR